MSLEVRHDLPQGLDREVDDPGNTRVRSMLLEDDIERFLGEAVYHRAVHLDKPSVAVPGKLLVATLCFQAGHRDVVEPQVEDRFHHSRHGYRGSGANRDQQGRLAASELASGGCLEPLQRRFDLGAKPGWELSSFEVGVAHR